MKRTARLIVTFMISACFMSTQVWADPKLIVEDGAANQVFVVNANGTTSFTGADANNAFEFKISGHTGGNVHTQATTGLADSRLTVMAAEESDYAPRLQMIGPQDGVLGVQGWMIFDYGSANYALPSSRFVLRHLGGGGKNDIVEMIRAIGRDAITFPTGNVGIGTTTPTHLIHLAGGAYSDGATWVNASSREIKKDIKEVTAEEALQTVENLKPVSFVYKEGNQDMHVGFIAEDVPHMVATGDRKGLESMDIAAVLTKVVQEQKRMLDEQQRMLDEQQRMLDEQRATTRQLNDKIVALENALQLKQDKDTNLAQFRGGILPTNF